MRNFCVAILRSSDSIHYMPSDYSLYRLGLYDSDTGRLIVDEVPTFLMRGEPAADSAPAAKPKRTTKTTQKWGAFVFKTQLLYEAFPYWSQRAESQYPEYL